MTAPPFRPMSMEEVRLEQLLAAFPGEHLEGLRDRSVDPYISPSQLKMFQRCPEQYRRRYVLGEKEAPAAALVWGSADHETFENHFAGQLAHGKLMTVEEIRLLFATKFDERVEKDGGVAEIQWSSKERLTGGDALKAAAETKDRGVGLAAAYRQQAAEAIKPKAIEERFEIRVAGSPVPIRGAIDLVADVPKVVGSDERVERIIDRKTSGRTAMSGEWHIQGRVYQLVKPLPIEWQLSVKNKTPKIVAFDPAFIFEPPAQRIVEAQLQRTIASIANCYLTFGPDDPWPDAIGSAWACGYCGFRPTCPWWEESAWRR